MHGHDATVGQNEIIEGRVLLPLPALEKVCVIRKRMGTERAHKKHTDPAEQGPNVRNLLYTEKANGCAYYEKDKMHQHEDPIMHREEAEQKEVAIFSDLEHGKDAHHDAFDPEAEQQFRGTPSPEKNTVERQQVGDDEAEESEGEAEKFHGARLRSPPFYPQGPCPGRQSSYNSATFFPAPHEAILYHDDPPIR